MKKQIMIISTMILVMLLGNIANANDCRAKYKKGSSCSSPSGAYSIYACVNEKTNKLYKMLEYHYTCKNGQPTGLYDSDGNLLPKPNAPEQVKVDCRC